MEYSDVVDKYLPDRGYIMKDKHDSSLSIFFFSLRVVACIFFRVWGCFNFFLK